MTKKTRQIILIVCALLFFIITPLIIFYSFGYRFDFETKKIVATGGIYVKASPLGTDVIVDSNTDKKTSIFSTYVFVQNLLPKQHSVLIKKEGYFDYFKNLNVKEKEVTKLERVTLFKKNPTFEVLPTNTLSPFTKPIAIKNFTLKNNNLYAKEIIAPILKNVIAFTENGNLTWLATDGFLYSSNLNGENVEKLTQVPLTISKNNTYEILIFNKNIFIKENKDLLMLDQNTKSFINIAKQIQGVKISPDNKKIAYYSDNEIFIYYLNYDNQDSYSHNEKITLNKYSEKINSLFWINDDYLLLKLENKIVITEIDSRNNINTIELPQAISLPSEATLQTGAIQVKQIIELKNPEIIFNQQDKKLYILNQKQILVSERLIP